MCSPLPVFVSHLCPTGLFGLTSLYTPELVLSLSHGGQVGQFRIPPPQCRVSQCGDHFAIPG
ncbi:hypothetical protein DPMN_117844 [Dreissena polymorpha]|uniref:Uncharacterized protein n=1 Tax=Dreissena polymorpha TaxID=45954 RepID=A0A9D4GJR3_DREPO|nr:hypothetical protein DPMN_117844 [Dreissena polymorpha]